MDIIKNKLEKLLKEKIINVKFKKTDGSERNMTCSLREDILPPYKSKTERKKSISEKTIAVWDLEKDAFRSFRLDSIIDYQVASEGYEL